MTPRNGFQLIPTAAKMLAAFVFVAPPVFLFFFFDEHKTVGLGSAMGAGMGVIAATFILLAGYVYADSSGRGMPPIPWTALALLIPNGVGFVLYFLLRKPIQYPCSKCGCGVTQNAAFCSRCGQSQLNAEVQRSSKES
jgi:hypothetical protein